MEKAWLSMLNHVSLQIHLYNKAKIESKNRANSGPKTTD